MYSYDQRMRAVRLYIQYDSSSAATIRELGYPSRKALYRWWKEYQVSGDLHDACVKRARFSSEEKTAAVDYYAEHGRNLSGTVRALGYPSRTLLAEWIDELRPGVRKVSVRAGRAVVFSLEQKRRAVIDLGSRDTPAKTVAQSVGVSRQTLYAWGRELLEEGAQKAMSAKKGDAASEDRDNLLHEVEELEKRLRELQLEHDILKKANELLKKEEGISPQTLTNREKTLLIDALKATYSVSTLLTQLAMPRSSYYYHQARLRTPEKYTQLRRTIADIFTVNKRRYGYRRVHMILRREGMAVSEKVVRRIMGEESLVVYARKRRRYSSYAGEISAPVENVVDRDFSAEAPNTKWLTDITEFQHPQGKVYLSPMIDCFDGMVVSWTIGTSPDAELVNTMLDHAIAGLDDEESPVVHSDRGSHYRWPGWIARMKQAGLTRSMSKKGCTPDNAACEGFFGRLKNEMYHNQRWAETSIEEFIDELDRYIRWYNTHRIKLSLEGLSPVEYRLSLETAA